MAADHKKLSVGSEFLSIRTCEDTELEPLGPPLLVSNSKRYLSRIMTQPRAVYESLMDPVSVTPSDVDASSQEDVLCQGFQGLDLSGTRCRTPDDDARTATTKNTIDRNEECADDRWTCNQDDNDHQSSAMAALNIVDENRTWEWTSKYEGRIRLDPHIKRSRHRKLDLMAQLQNLVSELEIVVSTLSPQVTLLDRQRWILHNENGSLKQKIAQLSDDLQLKADDNEALERELHWLRCQQEMEDFERRRTKSDDDGVLIVEGDDLESKQEQPKEMPHMIKAVVEEQTETSEQSNSSSQESDGNCIKQLVKWPSTLYRSVSAIRKDVLESVNFESI